MKFILRGLVILLVVTRSIHCQGSSSLTFSKNPAYNGDNVTVQCQLHGNGNVLMAGWIDVLNSDQQNEGTLTCIRESGSTSQNYGSGVFSGYSFDDCSSADSRYPRLRMFITALPSWDRDYRCTLKFYHYISKKVQNVTSNLSHLTIYERMPSTPKLRPSELIFNETAVAILSCESVNGSPPADIVLTVEQTTLGKYNSTSGNKSASLTLSVPLKNWHNAKATCSVKNHNFSDNTVIGTVLINYIANLSGLHVPVSTEFTNQTLNCSANITSYPEAIYQWLIPDGASIANSSSHNSPVIFIPRGTTGLFNCSATNRVILKEIVIIYDIKAAEVVPPSSPRDVKQIIVIAIIVIIFLAFVALIVYHRKRFWKSLWPKESGDRDCDSVKADATEREPDSRRKGSVAGYSSGSASVDDSGLDREDVSRKPRQYQKSSDQDHTVYPFLRHRNAGHSTSVDDQQPRTEGRTNNRVSVRLNLTTSMLRRLLDGVKLQQLCDYCSRNGSAITITVRSGEAVHIVREFYSKELVTPKEKEQVSLKWLKLIEQDNGEEKPLYCAFIEIVRQTVHGKRIYLHDLKDALISLEYALISHE